MSALTFKEINLRIYKHEPYPGVLFQPRVEPWYALHQQQKTMPQEYLAGGVRGFYKKLNMSMRYIEYYTGMPSPVEVNYSPEVKLRQVESSSGWTHIIDTPHGPFGTEYRMADGGCRVSDFPIKSVDDIPKVKWLYQHMQHAFSYDAFQKGQEFIGELGQPQFWAPRSPYQVLCLDLMAFEDFVELAMHYPKELDELHRIIDDSYDALYEAMANCPDLHIVNFGENVDGRLLTPSLFESYHRPFYEKRSNQLRDKGIHTTVHFDGSLRSLLPLLDELPFDGFEALTPKPQGDVSLEEIKEHVGDKVVLDMIPAIYFMEPFGEEEVMRCAEKVIDLFYPNLILGVSDELPMGAGPEAIQILEKLSAYCKTAR